jgi:hypothetical protein
MGYGSAGARHYNAVQKELLGWLGYGASPPITEVTSSGVYTLDPYEPTGTGPKALKVRTAVGDWFYVEYRQPIGADSGLAGNPNVANGVLVHYWNGLANGVYLLDMTPATASWTDPALTVGSTFTDAAGRVSITPVWANGTNAGVNVNVGAGCVRKLPAVSVTPAQQTGGGGTPLTYSVSVRNNDTNCGTSTFNLSVVAPSGWATAIAGVPMVLGQGGTATATLQLTSSATAAPTTYSATITASGPTLSSTATASYVVTPPVSGGGGGGAPGSFADSFDRPDSAQLGNGWSVVSGSLRLEGGEALSDSGRDLHMAVQPGVTGATQAVGATFASSSSKGNPQFGVAVRYQSPSTYYRCYRVTGGVSAVRISKVVNGAETVLKSVSIKNPKKHASFALSCQASGTSLSLSIDGQRKVSVTDSSLSSGSVGFLMGYATVSGRSESHRADNFTATAQ